MILDAEQRTDDWFRDRVFDVCIVGSGPAGVTLARRLGQKGVSVGLFEAGAIELTSDSQDVYKGTSVGQPYYALEATRLRFFGGSSNHWGGWTRPLDAYDFQPKAYNPLSGWPIAKTDLDPYAAEASEILNLPAFFVPPSFFQANGLPLRPGEFRFSRPITRFGEKYRDELQKSENVRIHLNANLVDIRLDDGRRAASEAVFRSYSRPDIFSVRARYFVLCLGGLENPRLLLNCNRQIPAGVGNEHDLVGRYFLEHPHAPVGRVVVRDPLTFMLVYSPTPQFMDEHRILNFGLRIGDMNQWNGAEFSGPFDPQPPCTVSFDALLAAEMKGDPPACPAHVGDAFVAVEQSLNPDNRVRLGTARDRFGLREIELDWQLSDTDLRTIKTAAVEAGKLMAAEDVGRLKVVDWLLNDQHPNADQLWGGNHHMGDHADER